MVNKNFTYRFLTIPLSCLCLVSTALAHDGEDHSGDTAPKHGKSTQLTGTIDIYQADDFKNGKSLFTYELRRKGKKYRIYFEDAPPAGMKSGDKVNVKARISKRGDKLYVPTAELGGATTIVASGTSGAVSGSRSLLLMRVTMNDGSVSCSADAIGSLMWSNSQNINGLFQSSSYGALSFNSDTNRDNAFDVVDVTIPYNGSGACDYSTWATTAESEASKKGFSLSAYQHRGLVLPGNTGCSWGGLGNLGGNPARIWVNGAYCNYADIYAHELGHNITMHHAAVPGGSEYDDRSCIMGYGGVGFRHFNAPHADQMGWLPAYEVSTPAAGASQQITLSALETVPADDGHPKIIKMLKADSGDTYYVSYRRKSGNYSSGLSSSYDGRTSIHYFRGGTNFTYLVTALSDGQTFQDSVNGLSFTQISHDDSTMTAVVQIGQQCSPGVPSISLAPAVGTALGSGTAVDFTVTVKNNDSSACAAATFNLSNEIPAGFSATLASNTIPLAAGQTGSTSLRLTSALTSTDGTYAFKVTAAASGHSSVSVNGSYIIDGSAPSAPGNLTPTLQTSRKKTNVNLSWSASSDSNGISGYEVFRNGALLAQTSGSGTNYSNLSVPSGTYTYQVRARDLAGNLSSFSNSVQVTVGSTSGGGGGHKGRRK